jgi:hypothetical protein
MHILITGGTGIIGSHLIPILLDRHQISVITRDIDSAREILGSSVTFWPALTQIDTLDDVDAVINLAGEPIADKRWTEKRKKLLCESRWNITERVASLISASRSPPKVLISASATGFYGNTGDKVVSELDSSTDEFTSILCRRWEDLALQAQNETTRVCLLRTGVVLSEGSGFLSKILLPTKLGCGTQFGNGDQYLPWIHVGDVVGAIIWLLENSELSGPFNLVSPDQIKYAQFNAVLSQIVDCSICLRVPAYIIRFLMGESSVLLLGSQRVSPYRLELSGFHFRWYKLDTALKDLLG